MITYGQLEPAEAHDLAHVDALFDLANRLRSEAIHQRDHVITTARQRLGIPVGMRVNVHIIDNETVELNDDLPEERLSG